jgi:hypothetical protein
MTVTRIFGFILSLIVVVLVLVVGVLVMITAWFNFGAVGGVLGLMIAVVLVTAIFEA